MGRNTHRRLPFGPLSCHHSCLFYSAAGPWSEVPDGCLPTRAMSTANQFTGIALKKKKREIVEFNTKYQNQRKKNKFTIGI